VDIVLGGKFEAALLRALELVNRPERIPTSHPYYRSLYRWTEPAFFDRVGTFVAVADVVEIGGADWSGGLDPDDKLRAEQLGLRQGTFGDADHRAPYEFFQRFVASSALSADLLEYISSYHAGDLGKELAQDPHFDPEELRRSQAEQYVSRIAEQIAVAGDGKRFLLLDERDMRIVAAMSEFIAGTPDLRFPFPQLKLTTIDGMSFGCGLLNFSPRDALSLAAVRADREIQTYAKEVRSLIDQSANEIERERRLLAAMRQARKTSTALRTFETVVETASLVAAPISYIPFVGNAVSIATDLASFGGLAAGKAAKAKQWHLLGVRAATVNIDEYLTRKGNL